MARFLSDRHEHYMRVNKAADVYLTRTQLDWLIIRPGPLRDEPGTGHVSAAVATDYAPITRDDVAGFIAASLHEPALRRIIIELTGGPTPHRRRRDHPRRRMRLFAPASFLVDHQLLGCRLRREQLMMPR